MPPHEGCRLPLRIGAPPVASWLAPNVGDLPPSLHGHYTRFNATTRQSAPLRRIGTFGLAVGAACAFSLGIAGQVLTFRTRARLSFAPPTCRMPLGQSQCIPQALPGRWVSPRFWHRLIAFRHFCSGSLALASLNHACRNLVPTFPQRSPPSLLTTAACGGLRSAPDCRPRRALLHLSYSCAPPFGRATPVTQDPIRTSAIHVVGSIGTIFREDLDNRALGQLCRFTFANSVSQHSLHAL